MQTRKLGRSGLDVSAIGLGCMGLNYHRGPAPDSNAMIALLRAAVGARRHLLRHGRGLRPVHERGTGRRSAGTVPEGRRHRHQVRPSTSAPAGLDSHPERIRQVAEDSLKRLRVEAIDLFYQHRVDPERADRRRRGRREGSHRRGQGQTLRPVRGGRRDHPPRARRAAGRGRPERVLPLVARA